MYWTKNPYSVKAKFSERLRSARKKCELRQQDAVDKISSSPLAPRGEGSDEPLFIQLETYKKWEYGVNQINIEWIPAICDTYNCDVGYLFGEYEEYTMNKQKIREKTKLSSKAIDWLLKNKVENPHLVNALNELFEYDDLADTLLSAIFDFAVSHFSHIVVSDVLRNTNKQMGSDESKRVLKFSVQECFSAVLDRIWNENQSVSMAMASMQINQLKRENDTINQEIGIMRKKKRGKNG